MCIMVSGVAFLWFAVCVNVCFSVSVCVSYAFASVNLFRPIPV